MSDQSPNQPKLLPEHIPFVEYMQKGGLPSPRNDRKTICVYVETLKAWTMAELPRAALSIMRSDYRTMRDAVRDHSETPEGADVLLPGERFEDAEEDLTASSIWQLMESGEWTKEGVLLMICAYHVAER